MTIVCGSPWHNYICGMCVIMYMFCYNNKTCTCFVIIEQIIISVLVCWQLLYGAFMMIFKLWDFLHRVIVNHELFGQRELARQHLGALLFFNQYDKFLLSFLLHYFLTFLINYRFGIIKHSLFLYLFLLFYFVHFLEF